MSFATIFRSGALRLAAAPLLVAGLAGCTQTLNTNVTRYASQLPAPQGQTFTVVADDPALAGGLEFSQYAHYVADRMAGLGYTPVNTVADANLIVRFDYGVDKGRERVRSTGFYQDPFYSPWYGYRGGFYGRRIGLRPYGAWGYGLYDPWFDNGYESYTVYSSGIELKIDRKADGARLFEGKAEALSTSNRLPYLVPNLVEAMFTDFPGHNGETVRISVAPEKSKRN